MPSLRSVRSSVPVGVEQVIAQALEKEPADRPREVSHFADGLLAANTTSNQASEPSTRLPRDKPSFRIPLRIAAVLLVVAALGLAFQSWSSAILADGGWEVPIAVMPFENRTGDPAYDNLGQSLADEVIGRLTTVSEIRVIDPYTAASLIKDSLGTTRLLDTLNVEHIIHGYIEERAGELVVNVSESDVDGFLSSRTRHRIDPEQIDIAQVALANTVVLTFLREVDLEDRFDPGGSVIGPGRDAYLAGNAALGQRTPAAMRDAVDSFREAIALEPSSAAALSALSSTYALALYYRYDVGLPPYQLAARSLAAADSAITVDPDVANGYSARGYVRALLRVEIDSAEADFARAEQLAPNAPNGPSWSARILARKGLIDEAFREARRARDLDPLQAGRRTALASLAFQLGIYEISIEESREAYRLEPRLSLATAYEGRALTLTGGSAECLALDFGVYELVRALCLHQLGRLEGARAMVEEAGTRLMSSGIADTDYLPDLVAQDLASYYGLLGDAPEAARWVTEAFKLSPAGVDERLLGSALFDAVRENSDYADALAEAQALARTQVADARGQTGPSL
jgi:TolB-like protein/tetratricopeptide (TPR) repeat protein